MGVPVDSWLVENMVSTLTTAPDTCIILGAAHWPKTGQPRIRHDGHRVHLVRYLYETHTGQPLDPQIALLPGGCRTIGCQNPLHRIQSRRRTLPKRKDDE